MLRRCQPDWLVEDYEGKLPCLVDSKEAYTESSNVVDYIEYFYPEPTLSIKDSDSVAKVRRGGRRVKRAVWGGRGKSDKVLIYVSWILPVYPPHSSRGMLPRPRRH